MEKQEIITQNQEIIITENYSRAVSLHRKICANAQAAQESLFEVCKGLKEMRDGKLYKELGYQNFEDYTQTELGFSRRNAYRYISVAENLSKDFVTSMSQIGMSKLAILTDLDEPERAEIIQNNDLESTSVKKLQEEIKRLKADSASEIDSMKTRHNQEKADFMRQKNELKKQLEEIEKDRQDWIDTNRENVELTQKISQLEEQIQELESRPVEVAVKDNSEEVERLKKQLEQEKENVRKLKSEMPKTQKIPDNQAVFNVYYQSCKNAVNQLFEFLENADFAKFRDKIYEFSDYINDRIENLE